MKYEVWEHKGEAWARVWHVLTLNHIEAKFILLPQNEVYLGHVRNGGKWEQINYSANILQQEYDQWLRNRLGHANSEFWECDRYYYPGESVPELPAGGLRAWLDRFERYQTEGRWFVQNTQSTGAFLPSPQSWLQIGFLDKDVFDEFVSMFERRYILAKLMGEI